MRGLKWGLVLLITLQLIAPFYALAEDININLLLQETQKKEAAPGEVKFIWWVPEDYWKASLSQNPNNTPEQTEAILATFRPYIIVAIVDGKMDAAGAIAYKSEADIRADLSLLDSRGNKYLPLAEDGINLNVKSFLAMMRPMLANILGPMGQNMYFYAFLAKDKDGAEIANPRKEGGFSVKLKEQEFKWDLPLSSLVAQKVCPKCQQKLNGTYKYCPWDGTPLS